jgi:DNA adenine methylase
MFKWVGSKRRLADEIIAHMPDEIEDYVEPFMGAAHVGLSLLKSGTIKGKVYFSDNNEDLISFWKALKQDPELLFKEIESYKDKINKPSYAKIRRRRPQGIWKKGARFYYLIKTSYRGLWRVNSDNEYNVAFCGCNPDSFLPDLGEMGITSGLLQNASIEVMGFRDALTRGIKGVYYLDPPYYNTYSSYTNDKFMKHDHVVLAYLFKKLKKSGSIVIESNSNESFIRGLYDGNEIFEVSVLHTTSATAGAERKKELIIK